MGSNEVNHVINLVFEMNHRELMQVLRALTSQWNMLFPDYEVFILSGRKNDPEGQKQLVEQAVRMIDAAQEEREAFREKVANLKRKHHRKF